MYIASQKMPRGDKVSRDNKRWQNYWLLLKIVDQVLSPVIVGLRHLIHHYHLKFRWIYPDNFMTPKMNFLVNYLETILSLC